MDDTELLDLFFCRSEEAIAELDRKYGKLCHKLARGILHSAEDAEECVNDAYLGVWNAIPPARPKVLSAFVCRIVRNRAVTRWHSNTAQRRDSRYDAALDELAEVLPADGGPEEALQAKELTRAIEGFLDTLSAENRVIFLRRYWFSDAYADIAAQVGLSETTVSVRLTRMRKQLRAYLAKMEVPI